MLLKHASVNKYDPYLRLKENDELQKSVVDHYYNVAADETVIFTDKDTAMKANGLWTMKITVDGANLDFKHTSKFSWI